MIQKSGVSPVDVVDIPVFIGFLYILGPLGAGFSNHQQYHMFWRFWRSKLHPVTWFFSTFDPQVFLRVAKEPTHSVHPENNKGRLKRFLRPWFFTSQISVKGVEGKE